MGTLCAQWNFRNLNVDMLYQERKDLEAHPLRFIQRLQLNYIQLRSYGQSWMPFPVGPQAQHAICSQDSRQIITSQPITYNQYPYFKILISQLEASCRQTYFQIYKLDRSLKKDVRCVCNEVTTSFMEDMIYIYTQFIVDMIYIQLMGFEPTFY